MKRNRTYRLRENRTFLNIEINNITSFGWFIPVSYTHLVIRRFGVHSYLCLPHPVWLILLYLSCSVRLEFLLSCTCSSRCPDADGRKSVCGWRRGWVARVPDRYLPGWLRPTRKCCRQNLCRNHGYVLSLIHICTYSLQKGNCSALRKHPSTLLPLTL